MGYTGKIIKNKSQKEKKFYKKAVSQNCPKERINGVRRTDINKQNKKNLSLKIIFTKTYSCLIRLSLFFGVSLDRGVIPTKLGTRMKLAL